MEVSNSVEGPFVLFNQFAQFHLFACLSASRPPSPPPRPPFCHSVSPSAQARNTHHTAVEVVANHLSHRHLTRPNRAGDRPGHFLHSSSFPEVLYYRSRPPRLELFHIGKRSVVLQHTSLVISTKKLSRHFSTHGSNTVRASG